MLHYLLWGDSLLRADLQELGPIEAAILIISHWHLLTAVNHLGVPMSLSLMMSSPKLEATPWQKRCLKAEHLVGN